MLQRTVERRLTDREVLEQGERAKAAAVRLGLRRVAVRLDGDRAYLALSFFMRNERGKQRKYLCLLAPGRISELTDDLLAEQLEAFIRRKVGA